MGNSELGETLGLLNKLSECVDMIIRDFNIPINDGDKKTSTKEIKVNYRTKYTSRVEERA